MLELLLVLVTCCHGYGDEGHRCYGVVDKYVDAATGVSHSCIYLCRSTRRWSFVQRCKQYCPEFYECWMHSTKTTLSTMQNAFEPPIRTFASSSSKGKPRDEPRFVPTSTHRPMPSRVPEDMTDTGAIESGSIFPTSPTVLAIVISVVVVVVFLGCLVFLLVYIYRRKRFQPREISTIDDHQERSARVAFITGQQEVKLENLPDRQENIYSDVGSESAASASGSAIRPTRQDDGGHQAVVEAVDDSPAPKDAGRGTSNTDE